MTQLQRSTQQVFLVALVGIPLPLAECTFVLSVMHRVLYHLRLTVLMPPSAGSKFVLVGIPWGLTIIKIQYMPTANVMAHQCFGGTDAIIAMIVASAIGDMVVMAAIVIPSQIRGVPVFNHKAVQIREIREFRTRIIHVTVVMVLETIRMT